MIHARSWVFAAGMLLALCLSLAGCRATPEALQLEGRAMGTTWHVSAYAPATQREALHADITKRLADLNQQMSAWVEDSALSRFNRAKAGEWIDFPPDLWRVLEHALDVARATDGAFDPTIAPLVALWGFGPDGKRRHAPPEADEIAPAKERVDWRALQRDATQHRVLQSGGIALDINALGPGYAVDAIAQLLDETGVESYLVELGGEMRARGLKPDGSPWRVAVESPDGRAEASLDTIIALRDHAVGTSGDYRVGFIHAGQRYSHTLDPRSGAPIQHELAAVTVVDSRAMFADAYAAALLVLGPDRGMAFATTHKLAATFTLRRDKAYQRLSTPQFELYRSQ